MITATNRTSNADFCDQSGDKTDQSAHDRNAEVRYQIVPCIHVEAVNLQYTGADEPREQAGCRSCHARRKDSASTEHQPEGYGGQDSDWSARPDTGPALYPEVL